MSLPSSMVDFVPFDRLLQKACCFADKIVARICYFRSNFTLFSKYTFSKLQHSQVGRVVLREGKRVRLFLQRLKSILNNIQNNCICKRIQDCTFSLILYVIVFPLLCFNTTRTRTTTKRTTPMTKDETRASDSALAPVEDVTYCKEQMYMERYSASRPS